MTPAQLRRARLSRHWTLDDMARVLGIDRATVWRWESSDAEQIPLMMGQAVEHLGCKVRRKR